MDYKKWEHLATDCWTKTLWKFLHEYGIKLQCPTYNPPQPQRLYDTYIMETLASVDVLTGTLLHQCNQVRLLLQALFWSDIVTGDGKRYHGAAFTAKPCKGLSLEWPWPATNPTPIFNLT